MALQKSTKANLKFEEIAGHIHRKLALCFFQNEQWKYGISQHKQSIGFFSLTGHGETQHEVDIATTLAEIAHKHYDCAISLENIGDLFAVKEAVGKAILIWEHLQEIKPEVHYADLAKSYELLSIHHEMLQDTNTISRDQIGPGGGAILQESFSPQESTNAQSHYESVSGPTNTAQEVLVEVSMDKKQTQLQEVNADLAHILLRAERSLYALGDLPGARESVEKAIVMWEKLQVTHPGVHNAELAQSYHNLGFYLDHLGDFAGAKESVEKAIGMREELEETHPGVHKAGLAYSYHNLGVYLDRLGDFTGAKDAHKKTVRVISN